MDEIQNLTHVIFPCISENSSQTAFVPVRSAVGRQDSNQDKPVPPENLDDSVTFK